MILTKTEALTALIGVALLLAGVVVLLQGAQPALGSTIQGNDYQSTSTAASAAYGAVTGDRLVKTGHGALGTVVVTGAAAGVVHVLDATTTDVTKRTGNTSTSSILIAELPLSLAAGDYVFDVEYTDGLYIDLLNGTMPTTTVTYR